MQNQNPMQQSLDNIYKRKAKIILDYENDRINEHEYKQLMSGNKIFMNNILSQYNSMYPKGAPKQLKHNYVSPSSLIGKKWLPDPHRDKRVNPGAWNRPSYRALNADRYERWKKEINRLENTSKLVTKSEYMRNIGSFAPSDPFGPEYQGEQF